VLLLSHHGAWLPLKQSVLRLSESSHAQSVAATQLLLVRLEEGRICCVHLTNVLESSMTSDDHRARGAELTHDRSEAINWRLGWESWLRRNDLSWSYRLVSVLIHIHSLMRLRAFMVVVFLFVVNEAYHLCLWYTLFAWHLAELF